MYHYRKTDDTENAELFFDFICFYVVIFKFISRYVTQYPYNTINEEFLSYISVIIPFMINPI